MIGFLKGKVLKKEPPVLLIDVQSVGYEIRLPLSAFYDVPEAGQKCQVWVHVVYREDATNAFGFLESRDRDFFRELIRVNGIGPNMALAILSGLTVDECIHAVHEGQLASFTQLPGIGKRTAERLILELKAKLVSWRRGDALQGEPSSSLMDAQAALVSLGYKAAEIKNAMDKVSQSSENVATMSSEDYIRKALQNLVKV